MAVNVKSLGKLFGKLNRGEATLANLSKSQLKQIDEARDLFRKGEAFKKGSEGYKFFTKEASDYAKQADEVVKRAQEQAAIKERVMKNIESSQKIRNERQFHQIQNQAKSNQARKAQQEAIDERVRDNVRRSQNIRQQKQIDKIYSDVGDTVEALGFSRSEVNQAVNSIKGEKLNIYDISDSELSDMIQNRIYQQRANKRFNAEYGPREQRNLGSRGSHRVKKQMAEEERLADLERRRSSSKGGSETSSSGTSSSSGGSAESSGGSSGSNRNTVEEAGIRKFMGNKFDGEIDNISEAFNSGQSLNQDTLRTLGRNVGLEDEVLDDFVSYAQKGKFDNAMKLAEGNRQNYINNPTLGDKLVYHRVPQKGAVVVGGAWLVSNMSASRGQQSNAELYGQQTPYM